ncbi:MAG TPA: ATP-binding cassette domain-containing protein, partial [Pyrinomonadaceae bacterium]|nr:ATP-binding cassette domain-containing protein [Pyrinomonadaceae bacterium]
MSRIQLNAVAKSFGDRVIIRGISIDLKSRSRVVVFGPSGCGKSTLLRLIAGLLAPDTGSLSIDESVVASDGKNFTEPE